MSSSRNFAPYLPPDPPTVTIAHRGGRESLEDWGLRSDISKTLGRLEDVGGLVDAPALGQAEWYINATTGSDDNDGKSSETALATLREWSRRTGTARLLQAATIYMETDLDETGFDFHGDYSTGGVTLIGTRTVIGTGSFTGVQVYDDSVSPGDDGQVTDAALPVSWTASGFVGQMVVITSGANAGATAWIVSDLGAKTARFSPFFNLATFNFVDPQVGETYEIVTLPRLQGGWASLLHFGLLTFSSIDMYGVPGATASLSFENGSFGATCCRIGGPVATQIGAAEAGTYIATLFQTDPLTFEVTSGSVTLYACALGSRIDVNRPGVTVTLANTIAQFGLGGGGEIGLNLDGGGIAEVLGSLFFAGFDSTVATDAVVTVGSGGILRLVGKVWGLDWDNGFGLWVDSDGSVLYPSPDNLTAHADVDGAAITEVRYGRTNTTYAAIGLAGVINAANNAMVVPAEFGP